MRARALLVLYTHKCMCMRGVEGIQPSGLFIRHIFRIKRQFCGSRLIYPTTQADAHITTNTCRSCEPFSGLEIYLTLMSVKKGEGGGCRDENLILFLFGTTCTKMQNNYEKVHFKIFLFEKAVEHQHYLGW